MTMPANEAITAHSDGDDRIVAAGELIAGLQHRCGGTVPGAIAIPALAELVGMARRFGLRVARPVSAQDGDDEVRAWAEIEPLRDASQGEGSCRIVLRHWQTQPLAPELPEQALHVRAQIDRALAELTARLDGRQCLLAVESDGADAGDLTSVLAEMRAGLGRPWTDFVQIVGDNHRQPLHWRLLDGCTLRIEGSERKWRASLWPVGATGEEPSGFELALTADSPAAPRPPAGADSGAGIGEGLFSDVAGSRMVGRELAPVLRQPIARIIANAETIRLRLAGPLDEAYANFAADIAVAGTHLLELVDDLADLEVIESPQFQTARDPIDLGDVARRAAGILGVRARDKRIELAVPADPAGLPARAEFRRVLQVLLNLIGNSIRYSPEGSRISVVLEPAGSRARIAVIDQGPGMSAEQQARVFEKGERLGRSGDGGSGLGLYISRRLARAMGGDLTVASVPGEGARFVLEVPAEE